MSDSIAAISTVDRDGPGSISALHPDIIRAHILTRLDGPTLASAASASSQLRRLSREPSLWSDICSAAWPSTDSPRVQEMIAALPGGHRSFFSDCFAVLDASRDRDRESDGPDRDVNPTVLISAVDLRYRGEVVLRRVVETETESDWFDHSPFLVDLLHHRKDSAATAIRFPGGQIDACRDLAEGLQLSWIVADPAGTRRAAELSSLRPVSVRRHAVTGEVHARFATVLAGGSSSSGESASELVQFGVSVTCGGSHAGLMHVREACLAAEDMDGVHLNGRDSMVILRRAMRGKRGKGPGREEEGRKRYEEFLGRKRERKERQLRNEGVLDLVSASLFGAFALLFLFWATMGRW